MPSNFYETAFFILLSFLLGNLSSWLIFGLHNVTKKDFDHGNALLNQRLDGLGSRMGTVETKVTTVTVALRAKKIIDADITL
jgi:hypothetical protein